MAKQIGKITKLDGEVEIIKASGFKHRAANGDPVFDDDVVTTRHGSVTITEPSGTELNIGPNQTVAVDTNVFGNDLPTAIDSAVQVATIDTVVQALDRGQDLSTTLDATAAGLTGGGEDNGHTFVALTRILETVTGNQYAYGYQPQEIPPTPEGAGSVEQTAQQTTQNTQPTAPQVPSIPSQPEAPVAPGNPTEPTNPPQPPVAPPEPPVPPVVPHNHQLFPHNHLLLHQSRQ